MTKSPRRARRLQRRQERARRRPLLNLVALMDVFTILVFFFLVHSSDVRLTASRKVITLPESLASQKPRETLVVTITKSAILVQGDPVATVSAALRSSHHEIGVLRTALRKQLGPRRLASNKSGDSAKEVTIMGDRSIPFELLKKVMVTCTRAGYGRISLSVLQRSSQPG